jgi:hypothetical protein
MGGGEIIGNQSVYWSVDHGGANKLKVKQNESKRPRANDDHNVATDTKAQGRDPVTVEWFDVQLRFESKAEATTQLQAAIQAVNAAPADASFFLNFRVPATVNGRPRTDPDSGPRPDVGIRWEPASGS